MTQSARCRKISAVTTIALYRRPSSSDILRGRFGLSEVAFISPMNISLVDVVGHAIYASTNAE